jgi:hypothetical protein
MRKQFTVAPHTTVGAARVRSRTSPSTEKTNYSSTSASSMSTEERKMGRRSGNASTKTVYKIWPPLYSAQKLPLSTICAKSIVPKVQMLLLERLMFVCRRRRIVSRLNSKFYVLESLPLQSGRFPKSGFNRVWSPRVNCCS